MRVLERDAGGRTLTDGEVVESVSASVAVHAREVGQTRALSPAHLTDVVHRAVVVTVTWLAHRVVIVTSVTPVARRTGYHETTSVETNTSHQKRYVTYTNSTNYL